MTDRKFAIVGAAILISTWLALPVVVRAGDAKPGFEKGKLQDVAKEIASLISLKMDGKKLKQDCAGDEENDTASGNDDSAIKSAFTKIQSVAGGYCSGGFGGSSGSGSFFQGNGLNGSVIFKANSFRVTFIEESEPMRIIQLSDDRKGMLRLSIVNPNGAIINLVQKADGKCTIDMMVGKDACELTGDSFLELYQRDHAVLEEKVLPLMRYMGVGLPVLPYSPQVKQTVLDLLKKPVTAEEKEKAETLLKNLDSENAGERESAAKSLGANFTRYSGLIISAGKSDSPEVRQRIKKILDEHSEQAIVAQYIQSLKLPEDPAYLTELLAGAKDEDKKTIAAELEKLTGEKLGDNVEKWRDYNKSKSPASKPSN